MGKKPDVFSLRFSCLMALAVSAAAAQAIPWDFDAYRKAYPEQVCTIRTAQSGKINLVPAMEFGRNDILRAWRDLIGPASRNSGPLEVKVLEEKDFPKFIRKKVEYTGDPGERIRAWLFIPKGLTGKAPAMLCLHQTVRSGKDQCAGVAEIQAELAYGPLLAERGFVTLCPDVICFGERYQVGGSFYCHYGDAVRIYQGNAGRSIMAKMVDDAMRAVDFLVSRPEVEADRIGCIGHSHGGYGTLFAMAFDERIKAGVVSSGFTCFRSDPTPDRWYRKTALIPRLGGFENRMQDTPVDFHLLFAAISPRPLFISAALQDSIFPQVGDVGWMEKDVRSVYQRDKAAEKFQLYSFNGPHAFTTEARDKAWSFLDQHLNGPAPKRVSAFFPADRLAKVRENFNKQPDAARLRNQSATNAAFWRNLSDEQLRDLVFGPGITRSWMVWSDGDCPACKQPVKMYEWTILAQKSPWKLMCPRCKEIFPKNDFAAFYRSGLNEKGWFDPKKGDRSLLFNAEHPDQKDPLHQFGVDDGEGYVEGAKRWRFIGAYLIYGQFKQLILGGAKALADAFVLTGEKLYAHKAGVLLNRLADAFPDFDYGSQGLVYEKGGAGGYISVWHDACEETRELALAYDQVFEGLRGEPADLRRNIEDRLLRDPLKNPGKIYSNFPRAEITKTVINTVLGWPDNRKQVEAMMDVFIKPSTAVDGVTGEKGLAGYTSYTIAGLAQFLEQYSRATPGFLHDLLERNPSLKQTYRFHIDTLCLDRYYPNSGDCGSFAKPADRYVGASFLKAEGAALGPSMYSFFWRLYEQTGDPAYVQVLFRENGKKLNGLPHDLFADDPAAFRSHVEKVIKKEGDELKLGSVNKEAWHMAILRSGRGQNKRAVWLDYDAGGGHSHLDGMTMGLFAHGLDLLPDFGYPPVQFGGWETEKAYWYRSTLAHNTVSVDYRNQSGGAGTTTLWADGELFHAVRASAPQLFGVQQYERTAVLIDVSDSQCYVLDIFRVAGGVNHTKFVYGPFGTVNRAGLSLQPAANPVPGAILRNLQSDPKPAPGWSVTWKVDDHFHVLPPKTKIGLRYSDFSTGVEAVSAEAWIAPVLTTQLGLEEAWIPCSITRKTGAAPLASTFVSVLEPFDKKSVIKNFNRLPLQDDHVAIEVELANGNRDFIISSGCTNADWQIEFSGDLCWLRRNKSGKTTRLALANCSAFHDSSVSVRATRKADFVELDLSGKQLRVVRGDPQAWQINVTR